MHGFSRDEALFKLENDLRNALRYGDRVVRIIHGQGKHSANFPVIKSAVRHWINESDFAKEHIESTYRGEDGSPYALANPGETIIILKVPEVEIEQTPLDFQVEEELEARKNAKRMRADRLRTIRRRRL